MPCNKLLILCCSALLWQQSAHAQQQAIIDPALSDSLLQLVYGLIVVIAVLFISLWLIKKLSLPKQCEQYLKVIGGITIGNKEKILLVQTDDSILVIGATAYHITVLHNLNKKSETPGSDAKSSTFSTQLKSAMEGEHDKT